MSSIPDRPADDPGGPRWYADGLRFECTQCGNCCRSHGEYSFLYLMEGDVQALADHHGLPREEFRRRYCKSEGGWWLIRADDPDCPFLDGEGRCTVYEARPMQCRTWPFWSENLREEVWKGPVKETCPGVDTGKLHSAEEAEGISQANDDWYEGAGDEVVDPPPPGV